MEGSDVPEKKKEVYAMLFPHIRSLLMKILKVEAEETTTATGKLVVE